MRIYGRMETIEKRKWEKSLTTRSDSVGRTRNYVTYVIFVGKTAKKPHDYPFILCTCETFKSLGSQTEFSSGDPSKFINMCYFRNGTIFFIFNSRFLHT